MNELGRLPFVACRQCRSRLGQFKAILVLRILLITPKLVVDERIHWPVPRIMAMLMGTPAGLPELGLDLVEPLLPLPITAGAVISGSYFGDRASPHSTGPCWRRCP